MRVFFHHNSVAQLEDYPYVIGGFVLAVCLCALNGGPVLLLGPAPVQSRTEQFTYIPPRHPLLFCL